MKKVVRKIKEASGSKRKSLLYVEPQLPPWWDWVVIALTVASLAGLVFEWATDLDTTNPSLSTKIQWADNIVCAIFISEFALRVYMAPRKLEFVRRNWVDLLGAVPMVDALRSARLVRFIRVLRITRFFSVVRRLARRYDLPMPKGALTNLGFTTVGIWLTSAYAFYHFEAPREGIESFADAAWWSMTTLSTVGYGDLYPITQGGRIVAILTMVLGIGLLGAVAATTAAVFIEWRDRGKKGLRRHAVRDHLLILGWNEKGPPAIENFRADPRHASTDILIVCNRDQNPFDDPDVRFVRGLPGKASILEKAAAKDAGAAIVLASRPEDVRSDHETALVIASLRRLNPDIRIAAELIDADNKEHLTHAGVDALVDDNRTIANLLVRSVQDEGVADVVAELLSSEIGSEFYRVTVPDTFVGKSFGEYAKAMIEESYSVIGLARGGERMINPASDTTINDDDDAFVIAPEPPTI